MNKKNKKDSHCRSDLSNDDEIDIESLKSSLNNLADASLYQDSTESRKKDLALLNSTVSSLLNLDTPVTQASKSAPVSLSRRIESVCVRNLVQDFERSSVRAGSTSALADRVAVPDGELSLALDPGVSAFLAD